VTILGLACAQAPGSPPLQSTVVVTQTLFTACSCSPGPAGPPAPPIPPVLSAPTPASSAGPPGPPVYCLREGPGRQDLLTASCSGSHLVGTARCLYRSSESGDLILRRTSATAAGECDITRHCTILGLCALGAPSDPLLNAFQPLDVLSEPSVSASCPAVVEQSVFAVTCWHTNGLHICLRPHVRGGFDGLLVCLSWRCGPDWCYPAASQLSVLLLQPSSSHQLDEHYSRVNQQCRRYQLHAANASLFR